MADSIEYRRREGLVYVDGQPIPIDVFEADPLAAVASKTPVEDARKDRLASIAAERWAHSQRFIYDGVETPCDDGARAALIGAVVGLQMAQSNGPITWKLGPGEFRTWNFAELVAFGQAMRGHVQACFDNEALLTQAIALAPTSADVARIDLTQGWPLTAVPVKP